jgi:hypothetical protein
MSARSVDEYCKQTAQCAIDLECVRNVCRPRQDPLPMGHPCLRHGDCLSGECVRLPADVASRSGLATPGGGGPPRTCSDPERARATSCPAGDA